MQFTIASIATLATFLPVLVSAHVRMIGPSSVFTHNDGTDWSPLSDDGTNYPCTVIDGGSGDLPVFEPGSAQQIELRGSAVHGGGSCQISFTYDNPPTKNSVFRVVKSFEGACPLGGVSGNLLDNPLNLLPSLPFTVPKDMPAGEAVVAWTWFNRIGNREMYMRCAPVKIGGSNTDTSKFETLPEILKANIGNGCSTEEGTDVIFPNPGSNVVGKGTKLPSGNCGSVSPPSGNTPQPSPPILIVDPETSSTPISTPTPTPTPDTQVEQPNETPVETPVEKPVEKPVEEKPTPTPTPTPSPELPTEDLPVGNVPEVPGNNGSCVDGTVICDSLTTWSLCNFGKPVPMGRTADGTNCRDGMMVLAPRSIRFSHEHIRRRHHTAF